MVKNLILGAGITGLSSAFFLQKDYEIIEKSNHVGGLADSIEKNGFVFDFGEKFLRIPSVELESFFHKLMGDNFFSQELKSAIFFKERHIPYPFQDNLRDLPPVELRACAKSLLLNFMENARNNSHDFKNFEEFIHFQNGNYVANEFMIPYNQKIWAVPPREMNNSWFLGKNVIPTLTLDDILNSILPQDGTIKQNPKIRWYPKRGGSKEIGKAFLSHISNLRLNTEVKSINLSKKKVVFFDNSIENYEHLINTIPLNEFLFAIEDLPAEIRNLSQQLKYNTVFCLNLCLDYEQNIPYHWIYYPQKEVPFSRMFFSSNFSKNNAPSGKSSCSALVTYLPQAAFNQKFMEKSIIETLLKLKIIEKESTILDKIPLTIKYGFTIPTIDLPKKLDAIKNFLKKFNVFTIGRYGEWKYSGIEHAIEDGKNIAQQLKNT